MDWTDTQERTAEERAARAAQARLAEIERQRAEAWERDRPERERRQAEATARRQAAEERAQALLKLLLSEAQWAAYQERRAFEVVAASGKRYRIRHGWAGNVSELDEAGKAVSHLCIHLTGDLPEGDNLVAQKLLLEADEARFRQIANISPAYRRPAAAA